MSTASAGPAPGGTIKIAGKTVSRIGLGTMRLTGPETWGPPPAPDTAIRVLREAVHDHGITHIDTANAYGPHTAEELIKQALHPYPEHLLIATKVGMIRPGPHHWAPLGRPDYLRASVEASLRRLGVDELDLCYLHRIDPTVPAEDQVGELRALQKEGKIHYIGLSKVKVDQVRAASTSGDIAAVQNCLNQAEPNDPVLGYCRDHGISYIPYRPLNAGLLAQGGRAGDALRWLLDLGDHVAPIPGTSSREHLRELVTDTRADDLMAARPRRS